MRDFLRKVCLCALLAAGTACGSGPDPDAAHGPAQAESASGQADPPTAHREIVEMLRAAREVEHDPSDGGGRAWLERADPERPGTSTPGRFTLVYEVGPLGVASEGGIYLQVSPFWDWSTPQVETPGAPGYTTIEADAADIELDAQTLDQQLLGIRVAGRPLVAGERIRITYGAGELGALADRYAERNSRFWIAVDGDGDGTRSVLADSPGVDVLAGPPARLQIAVPSVARPGETIRVTVAFLDLMGNAAHPLRGQVAFDPAPGLDLPRHIELEEGDRGHKTVEVVVREPGVYRLKAVAPGELTAVSNPMLVSATGPRVFWADLHGHSALSDGTGLPEDYFLYARDVAALDVVALTDHDHWGILPLATHPELWDEIQRQTRRFHEPGRFVTLLGYEWTSWIHGHRHVIYFDDEGDVFSSVDPEYESPQQLWKALEGKRALTFAHHSAGGPIATNWSIPPDPRFEPVTEIVSVHGSSEALDSPALIYSPVPGNFVRDALDRGYRFGFIGSGDSHDGHPGLAHLSAPSGGLAAIVTENLSREAVLEALRARRVYATSGPRILLRTALGTHPMGSTLPAPESGAVSDTLFVHVLGTAPIERVDLVRSGEVVDALDGEGRLELALERPVSDLRPGEYLYVRAVQQDGAVAWSSPIFVE
ncbi:MAG: CehA/McbA family metallohydrolase [Myxococcota bacterium]